MADIKQVMLENNAAQNANEKEIMLIINKFKASSNKRLAGKVTLNGYTPDATVSLEEYLEEISPKIESFD